MLNHHHEHRENNGEEMLRQNKACERLWNLGKALTGEVGEITISLFMTLLTVAKGTYGLGPQATSRTIQEETGYSQSTVSRNIALLSDIGTKDKPGYGLIEVQIDPSDRRKQLLTLTRKGRDLCDKLALAIAS
ncbi:DNA-binding MarR family transcriptional regulator [Microvirga flocculans]|uniref:DNA-binding MarR family transcriptional regulator n=1 Tax=Microvirga flocculans TaxID=217168 RepID=A0A7W6N748_9HYPH|nr:MarR family winged helix-turn-helix transcriptional regulator [Microvirga flocculans]MBB4039090.1 DNA-binding MarR family transcriptional regulator [Microvirga flocculans]